MWKIFWGILLYLAGVNGKPAVSKQRVCIIGAGPAGLISAKQLSAFPDEFEIIVFEKQSAIGGMWIYTDSTTVDEHGLPVHSSLYKYMRVNGPKEVLRFPDYTEIKGENTSWVKHETILKYLRSYAQDFDLRQYIQLNTNVEQVSPLPGRRWLIAKRDLNTQQRDEVECDAVMIANGQNYKGNIPDIPGIETFPGRVLHSHLFRKPEEFAGQTVVVLGAKYSGTDIGIEITQFAKTVYLSSRHDKLPYELPTNMIQIAGVVGTNGSELILSDNSTVKADAVVFCTGYIYDFPFLDASTGIVLDAGGKYIRYLYKNLINIERPTMAIFNVPQPGIGLFLPPAQVQYFVSVLRGKTTLPSREEMMKEAALPPGTPESKAHYLLEDVVKYYNELSVAAGGNSTPPFYEAAVKYVIDYVTMNPLHFREKNFYVYDNGTFEFA